jgi:hypothetical protein
MAEFTIIVDHMIEAKSGRNNPDRLVPETRTGDVIEAENIDDAWVLARKKYYSPDPRFGMMQIVNIVPGNVEVDPRVTPLEPEGVEVWDGQAHASGVAESAPETNGGTEPAVPGGDGDR